MVQVNTPCQISLLMMKLYLQVYCHIQPQKQKRLSLKNTMFNYDLSEAQQWKTHTFGINANKWRIFHGSLNVNIDYTHVITKEYVMLCSFVLDSDGYNLDCALHVEGLYDTHMTHIGGVEGGGKLWSLWKLLSEQFSTHTEPAVLYCFTSVSFISITKLPTLPLSVSTNIQCMVVLQSVIQRRELWVCGSTSCITRHENSNYVYRFKNKTYQNILFSRDYSSKFAINFLHNAC